MRTPYPRRPLSYSPVGATRSADFESSSIPGYRSIARTARVGSGQADWDEARRQVFAWALQTRAGIRLRGPLGAPRIPLQDGDLIQLRFGVGRLAFRFPAVVVWTVDEPHLAGFAYGTLPGHSEAGEEAFLVERRADDSVWVVIRAFSQPSNLFWKLVDPALRIVQRIFTDRYLRALRR
ncbi:DUF1990 family protein [Naasia lichenicola]|uniref:DUF1990 family protein n=1 Tax=Naasia lichenicola TaxID=2565933 RepID=UPI00130DFA5D|nr:DUF1990 domain-containing protein [Naasia lichenicola]